MKATIFSIAATGLLAIGLYSFSGHNESTYSVDTTKTKLQWTGTFVNDGHAHTGTINITEGTVKYHGDAFESGDFKIDMSSINTTDLEGGAKTSLDNHLKGPKKEGEEAHFFDAVKFPDTKVTVKSVTDKDMTLVINVMGMDVNTTVPVTLVKTDKQLTANAKFSVDFTSAGIVAFKEDPAKPKMYISPELKFDMNLVMNAK